MSATFEALALQSFETKPGPRIVEGPLITTEARMSLLLRTAALRPDQPDADSLRNGIPRSVVMV